MRTTTRGLTKGESVHVKGNDIQAPFDGIVIDANDDTKLANVRRDYNGGVYLVRIDRIRRICGTRSQPIVLKGKKK